MISEFEKEIKNTLAWEKIEDIPNFPIRTFQDIQKQAELLSSTSPTPLSFHSSDTSF